MKTYEFTGTPQHVGLRDQKGFGAGYFKKGWTTGQFRQPGTIDSRTAIEAEVRWYWQAGGATPTTVTEWKNVMRLDLIEVTPEALQALEVLQEVA